jgi:hypothetical protein
MAAKWLLGLTNDFDWGLKVWDDLEEKSRSITVSPPKTGCPVSRK